MGVLLESIDNESALDKTLGMKTKEYITYAHQFINDKLDDILVNTYAFIHLKPNLPNWIK